MNEEIKSHVVTQTVENSTNARLKGELLVICGKKAGDTVKISYGYKNGQEISGDKKIVVVGGSLDVRLDKDLLAICGKKVGDPVEIIYGERVV